MISNHHFRSLSRILNVTAPLALVLVLLMGRLFDPGHVYEKLRLSVTDLYSLSSDIRPTAPIEGLPNTYLVAIDDNALAKFGQWPWSREKVAEIVLAMYEKGAAAVAVDLIFAEPDRLSPKRFLSQFDESAYDITKFANQYGYSDTDEFFAEVLSQTPTAVAVATADHFNHDARSGYSYGLINADLANILSVRGLHLPNDTLNRVGPFLGHDVVVNDRDGIIRKLPVLIESGDEYYPALFASLLAAIQRTTTIAVKGDAEFPSLLSSVRIGGVQIPTNHTGDFYLLPSMVPNVKESLSLTDVLSGQYDNALKDSLLILAPTATGLAAQHDIPHRLSIPGSLLHVGALRQLKRGYILTRDDQTILLEWVAAISLSLISVVVVIAFNGAMATIIFGFIQTGLIIIAFWAYTNHGVLFDWSFAVVTSLIGFLAAQIIQVMRTEGEKGEIRKAFSTYLSPELVEQLSKEPEKLKLGGERKEVTVLFADIRGFTALSENFIDRPDELTRILNELLTPLTDVIISHQGTIDKYMGDAIMAFWNAPLDVDKHADKAVLAALDMQSALASLNERLMGEGRIGQPLSLGVGINTGTVLVGNLGSEQRFDYSCIGDTVNLASRIEGLTKQLGMSILLGGETAKRISVSHSMSIVRLDDVFVVGKQQPESIFGVIDRKPEWLSDHQLLWRKVKNTEWDAAQVLFDDLVANTSYPEPLKAVLSRRLADKDSGATKMLSK